VKLKEAGSKLSTAGTRIGSEAGCVRPAGWQQRSPKSIKTHQVEPGGPRGKILHLTWGELLGEGPGAVSRGRSSEESCESGWSEGPKDYGAKLEEYLQRRTESDSRAWGVTTTVATPCAQRPEAVQPWQG
jgi:hypothetical protein